LCQVEIVIDAKKRPARNPLSWTYGVSVRANGLEQSFTFGILAVHEIQVPRKMGTEEIWIAVLAAIIAKVIRQLGFQHCSNIRLHICKDLSCKVTLKLALLINAVAEILQVSSSIISAEFVTRSDARGRPKLAVLYGKAHKSANREKPDMWCDPAEVEDALKIARSFRLLK
jgi:hypothetical protein